MTEIGLQVCSPKIIYHLKRTSSSPTCIVVAIVSGTNYPYMAKLHASWPELDNQIALEGLDPLITRASTLCYNACTVL